MKGKLEVINCEVCGEESTKPVYRKARFCSHKCANQRDNEGRFKKGKESRFWKGGRYIAKNGYVYIYAPWHHRANSSKYVAEHILVAESKIGRLLEKNEEVHHIDCNKLNNNPDNLLVLTRSEHRKLELTIDKARNSRTRESFLKGWITRKNMEVKKYDYK